MRNNDTELSTADCLPDHQDEFLCRIYVSPRCMKHELDALIFVYPVKEITKIHGIIVLDCAIAT